MESEQTGLAFTLPLSLEHVRVNSPVEFAHEYLCPDPEACNVQGSSFFLFVTYSIIQNITHKKTLNLDPCMPTGQDINTHAQIQLENSRTHATPFPLG